MTQAGTITNRGAAAAAPTLNVDRLRELADIIEGVENTLDAMPTGELDWLDVVCDRAPGGFTPDVFDMTCWLTSADLHARPSGKHVQECGTAGCIAGFTVAHWADEAIALKLKGYDLFSAATAILGLDTDDDAMRLFVPSQYSGSLNGGLDEITPAQAAACLRYVADGHNTGWAWSRATLDRMVEEDDDREAVDAS